MLGAADVDALICLGQSPYVTEAGSQSWPEWSERKDGKCRDRDIKQFLLLIPVGALLIFRPCLNLVFQCCINSLSCPIF